MPVHQAPHDILRVLGERVSVVSFDLLGRHVVERAKDRTLTRDRLGDS